MACYPWHYFKTNYVVIIILVVSIISFNLAWQYYGGVDVKNAAIDPENSSDTKKEEIIIENYFLFNTVNTVNTLDYAHLIMLLSKMYSQEIVVQYET